jgi:hypothetical protein
VITDKTYEYADLVCMLLSNLAKSPRIDRLFGLQVLAVTGMREKGVLGQLMEVFVLGEDKKWNGHATFDFLANVWGDITRVSSCISTNCSFRRGENIYWRRLLMWLVIIRFSHCCNIPYPLPSFVGRGLQMPSSNPPVASDYRNSCFDTSSHTVLLDANQINLLPALLLPLSTAEEFPEDDSENIPMELQLLPGSHKREESNKIICAHLESLLLLTTTFPGREMMRKNGVYPVIRRLHEEVEDEEVRATVERLVNVLMRDEEKVQEVDDEIEEVA